MNTTRFAALAALVAVAACQDDPAAPTPSRAIPATARPALEAPAPLAYVTHTSSSTVRVINTVTNAQVAVVPVGSYPWEVAVSPDGTRAYVPANGSGTVTVINTATHAVTATLNVGWGPQGMTFSRDGSRAYVTNSNSGTLVVIDTDTTNTRVIATVPVGSGPYAVAASPDGSRVYVSRVQGSVLVLDGATLATQATIPVGMAPMRIAMSPNGARLYVANNSSGTVSVINTATDAVVATVPVGQSPLGIEVSPDGAEVWVLNQGNGTASVISTATNAVVATVPVGGGPIDVAFTTDGTKAIVSYNASSNGTLAAVNTATHAVSTMFTYPGSFFAVAVTPQAQAQTITFAPLPDRHVGDPSFGVAASASSGLPVTFSSLTPLACAVSGATVTPLAAGTCEVAADQPGSAAWLAAPRVTRAFAVSKRAQSIALLAPSARTWGDAPFVVSATASSGLPVAIAAAGDCAVAGSTVTLLGAGSCTLTATQEGDAAWAPAPAATQVVSIARAAQAIAFAELPDRVEGDAPFTLSATASSGLGVTFAAVGECTVAGATLTLTSAGSCTVTASQAGDENYLAAPGVTRSFAIVAATPPPPPAPTAPLTIDPLGRFEGRTGIALVAGSVTCGGPGTLTLAVTLWQHQLQGTSGQVPALAVSCPAAGVVRWSTEVRAASRFVGGPATATASIVGSVPEVSVRQGIRLKP